MTTSFLCCFDPQLDRLDSKRFAMWANLTEAYGIKLLLYGDPIPRTPLNTRIFPTIAEAQETINQEAKCLVRRQKAVEWVFMISPLASSSLEPTTALRHFQHPAEAVYVFGPDYEKWDISNFQIDHRVEVATFQGTGELHALTVAAIVVYHRYSFRLPNRI